MGAALAGRLRQWELGAGLHILQPPGWALVTAAAGGARRGAGPDPERERARAGSGSDSSPPPGAVRLGRGQRGRAVQGRRGWR